MSDKKNESYKWQYLLAFILLALIIIWIWFIYPNTLPDYIDHQKLGTYGDSYGGLNALFSGLAFAGLIVTILLQMKELGLQRQELKETKEALEKSAEANQKTVELIEFQTEAQGHQDRLKIRPNWKVSNYSRSIIPRYSKKEGVKVRNDYTLVSFDLFLHSNYCIIEGIYYDGIELQEYKNISMDGPFKLDVDISIEKTDGVSFADLELVFKDIDYNTYFQDIVYNGKRYYAEKPELISD